MNIRVVVAAMMGAAASPLLAQPDAIANLTYPVSQRVRVLAPSVTARPIIGTVAAVDSQALSLAVTRKGTTVAIPLGQIAALSASGGPDRGKGVRRGALVGLAFGTYFFADSYSELSQGDYFGIGRLALGLVAFGITPGIGALAGYALSPERWDPMAVPDVRAATQGVAAVRFAADEDVRLATSSEKVSGRVLSQNGDVLRLSTGDGPTTVHWGNVRSASVRGEPSRKRGAVRGVIVITGITAIGIATDPLPTAAQNVGVALGNVVFGALVGAFFPSRGRTDLPVRPSP
jgi:hypothetical protein